jgi:hypothetical protein
MEMCQYLNPRMVQSYGIEEFQYNNTQYKNVLCYDGVIFKVCPNPDNKEICKIIEDRYKNGLYIGKKTFSLTKEQFEDRNFWNSI